MSLKTERRVLLVRPKYSTGLTKLGSLATEPLELEYLARAVRDNGDDYHIWDGQVDGSFARICKTCQPDVIAITGYYPARDRMLEYARLARAICPESLILIGGVHAELNQEDFRKPEVDLIIHSGGFFTFREILTTTRAGWPNIAGISFRLQQNRWQKNRKAFFDPVKLPHPDRTYFHARKKDFTYLYYGTTAIVKTGFGCPFDCSFCYCRLLNNGLYQPRDVVDVADEISAIDCPTIWIIDDTFLLDRKRLRRFAEEFTSRGIQRRFIIYGRASFISDHPEILPVLQDIGVVEVIVGLESVDDATLHAYGKGVNADQNRRCVALLREHDIGCTGLFIMDRKATAGDFFRLDRWIKEVGLSTYTISIFSPFPGSDGYHEYAPKLTTTDCRKWDLLHLVLEPVHLSRLGFLARIYWLHCKILLRNKRIRNHLIFRWRRR
jgi:radical SAM superfamily enzyme YgiQ (UPF0313 family)